MKNTPFPRLGIRCTDAPFRLQACGKEVRRSSLIGIPRRFYLDFI